jgi:hypothetical protein
LLTDFEREISVLLVLVVSQISHSLDLMIGFEVLSVSLLVNFAFIKVFWKKCNQAGSGNSQLLSI